MFPEAALLGLAAALAGATIGAWIGAHLAVEQPKRPPGLRVASTCSAAVLAALVAFGLHSLTAGGVSARVALHDVGSGPERQVEATIALRPPDAAEGAKWFELTGLAGRWPRGRSPRADRAGPLPQHRAGPGLGQLEGDDPPAQGRLDGGAAGLPTA
jgi:hypothetical protein